MDNKEFRDVCGKHLTSLIRLTKEANELKQVARSAEDKYLLEKYGELPEDVRASGEKELNGAKAFIFNVMTENEFRKYIERNATVFIKSGSSSWKIKKNADQNKLAKIIEKNPDLFEFVTTKSSLNINLK